MQSSTSSLTERGENNILNPLKFFASFAFPQAIFIPILKENGEVKEIKICSIDLNNSVEFNTINPDKTKIVIKYFRELASKHHNFLLQNPQALTYFSTITEGFKNQILEIRDNNAANALLYKLYKLNKMLFPNKEEDYFPSRPFIKDKEMQQFYNSSGTLFYACNNQLFIKSEFFNNSKKEEIEFALRQFLADPALFFLHIVHKNQISFLGDGLSRNEVRTMINDQKLKEMFTSFCTCNDSNEKIYLNPLLILRSPFFKGRLNFRQDDPLSFSSNIIHLLNKYVKNFTLLEIDTSNVEELTCVADEYLMPELHQQCDHFYAAHARKEMDGLEEMDLLKRACELYRYSLSYDLKELKNAFLEYLKYIDKFKIIIDDRNFISYLKIASVAKIEWLLRKLDTFLLKKVIPQYHPLTLEDIKACLEQEDSKKIYKQLSSEIRCEVKAPEEILQISNQRNFVDLFWQWHQVAVHYNLAKLQKLCEKLLFSKIEISSENLEGIFQISKKFNLQFLIEKCHAFLIDQFNKNAPFSEYTFLDNKGRQYVYNWHQLARKYDCSQLCLMCESRFFDGGESTEAIISQDGRLRIYDLMRNGLQLQRVDLSPNTFENEELKVLQNQSHIEELSIDNLSQIGRENIEYFHTLPQVLENAKIKFLHIKGDFEYFAKTLPTLTALKKLKIENASVIPLKELEVKLENLCDLEMLTFKDCNFALVLYEDVDENFDLHIGVKLGQIKNLKFLKITNSIATPKILAHLKQKSLKKVQINNRIFIRKHSKWIETHKSFLK